MVKPVEPKATFIADLQGAMRKGPHPRQLYKPKPKYFGGCPTEAISQRASELWDEHIKPAHWLSHNDGPFALVWCKLTALFEDDLVPRNPLLMAQWRGLGNDLGLTSSAKQKIEAAGKKSDKIKKRDEMPDASSQTQKNATALFGRAA